MIAQLGKAEFSRSMLRAAERQNRGVLVWYKAPRMVVRNSVFIGIKIFIGQIAQSVEQRTENPCVGGSIPPLATIYTLQQNPITYNLSFIIKQFNYLVVQ